MGSPMGPMVAENVVTTSHMFLVLTAGLDLKLALKARYHRVKVLWWNYSLHEILSSLKVTKQEIKLRLLLQGQSKP